MEEQKLTQEQMIKRGLLKIGDCEVCPKTDIEIYLHYGNMWFCSECWEKDQKLTAENMTPDKQQARVDDHNNKMNIAIEASKLLDNSIQVRTDLFNAATVAIVDLKKLIDNDDAIVNKPYALAEILTERFKHYQQVVFEANEAIVNASNNQKAIQVYLNQLANQLHAEEREKLKIQDINYKPGTVKPVKPAAIKTRSSKKFDKVELNKYAMELGVSNFTLQQICVARGLSPEQAANVLRKSIAESKSEA